VATAARSSASCRRAAPAATSVRASPSGSRSTRRRAATSGSSSRWRASSGCTRRRGSSSGRGSTSQFGEHRPRGARRRSGCTSTASTCALPPASCDLIRYVSGAPAGNLILGRSYHSTTGPRPDTTQQFYGFVDDVAVFDQALSDAAIAAHADPANAIDGSEQSLLSGWNFDAPLPTSSFAGNAYANPFVGGSTHVQNGFDANELDAPFLPLAAETYGVKLPFASKQQWAVTQGYASGDSHSGTSAFAMDLARQDGPTIGSEIYAPASGGIVREAVDNTEELTCPKTNGTVTNCNRLQLELPSGIALTYMHLKKGSITAAFGGALPAPGAVVPGGMKIAKVGDHPNGAHLHIALDTTPINLVNAGVPDSTVPAVFKGYEILSSGIWQSKSSGLPVQFDVVRNP
jgi:hypothetical protein